MDRAQASALQALLEAADRGEVKPTNPIGLGHVFFTEALRRGGIPASPAPFDQKFHVILNVVVPSKLSRRERELLRELDEVSQPAVLPKGGGSIIDRLRDFFG